MSGKNNMPGPAVSIASIIDHYTEKAQADRQAAYSGGKGSLPLRPSSAGKCARALAYELMEHRGKTPVTPEEQSASVTRIFSIGHDVERHLFYQCREAFKAAEGKIRIKYQQQTMTFFQLPLTGEWIEGQIDAAFVHDAWMATVDVKSKKDGWDKAYQSRWQETDAKFDKNAFVERIDEKGVYIDDLEGFLKEYRLVDPFFCDNIYQLNFYYWSECGFLPKRNSQFCSLLYYNKNSSELREVRFKPSKAVAEYVKQKFLAVHQAVDGDGDPTLVERESVLGGVRCAYCKFNSTCWDKESYKIKKEYFKTLPPKRWPKRIREVDSTGELAELFNEYQNIENQQSRQERIEAQILNKLAEAKIFKVELDNGDVFEVKSLKSGGKGKGARRVLRRGKK